MEDNSSTGISNGSRVKATLQLGSEIFSIDSSKGNLLSEQIASLKEGSMSVLKDFITTHNIPIDVPDEPIDCASEDEAEKLDNPPKKSKRQT